MRAADTRGGRGPVSARSRLSCADVAFVTLEPPDPPSGEALLPLAREEGGDYGRSSDGRPRTVTFGDSFQSSPARLRLPEEFEPGVTEVTERGPRTSLSSRQHLNLPPSTHRRDCPPPAQGATQLS